MEDYKRMWFELKKDLLVCIPGNPTITKEQMLRRMASLEVAEFLPKPKQVVIAVDTKCTRKWFKG